MHFKLPALCGTLAMHTASPQMQCLYQDKFYTKHLLVKLTEAWHIQQSYTHGWLQPVCANRLQSAALC